MTLPELNHAAVTMERPKHFKIGGKFGCTHSIPYCIEYVMLTAERPLSPKEIEGYLEREFRLKVHRTNMFGYMKERITKGAAVRLGRGLYLHPAHLPKFPGHYGDDDEDLDEDDFDEPAAPPPSKPTLADLLS